MHRADTVKTLRIGVIGFFFKFPVSISYNGRNLETIQSGVL